MIKMIIYFYLFIPLLCRLAESSSIKGRNHKNDLVPFLSSRLDTQKDNSLKIVSNEPFIIQFQMSPESKENVHKGAKMKDRKKKRPDKKRISKIKPLRKKIRARREVSEAEIRKEKPDQSTKLPAEVQGNQNQTRNFISRQEMLKALNIYLKKKETKKVKPEGMKNFKDEEKTDATSSRNLHRNHSPSLPDRDPHVKMIYPKTPKSDPHNYSYKDLIADRERLEQKINYIRNMLQVNDSTAEDPVRIRRKSDSDNTANKIAKLFLTLSAVNGLHEKKSKCRDDDDDRALDVWEKVRKKSPSRQSSSSNEERYKVKKWIEYMKSKRSSGKTCPCMNEYKEENDIFPLEQKLAKDYLMTETSASSEENSDKYRDPLSYTRGKLNKSGPTRNSCREDARSKLRAWANRGRRKYDLPIDDLEHYRSRAKQILQNAEEILDKIKEEEEKRLAAPYAVMSRLKELTSRIQGDPRNNENDLINVIQKNLGWTPQIKSQPSTDSNSFVENMKSFILDPYEKAKALTDESTRKLSSYLLRNLGKIDSSEEQEEAAVTTDQRPQIFHGQVPQTEEMFSANLAKENLESDLLAKEREEHQSWSDTLSAILGGNDEDFGKKNTQGGELKEIKGQEDSVKKRMEEMIKEQGKKISERTEKPDEKKMEETTIIDLMAGEPNETPKGSKQSEGDERVEEMFESEKRDENVDKSKVNQKNRAENEAEVIKSTAEETATEVIASEYQLPSEEKSVNEEFAESVGKKVETEGEDDKTRDFPLKFQKVKAAANDDSTKEDKTVAKNLEDGEELDSATADENQDENAKYVMKTGSPFEKGATDEKGQALESSQKQNDNVQSKQEREENDVVNSEHLVQESDERSKEEKFEAFTEDIQKLLEKNTEETEIKSGEYEGTVVKKKYDSSEMKDPEGNAAEVNSSPDSVKLQGETTSKETQKEFSSESNALMNGVVQASQDPKESLQIDDSEKDKPIEKENSAEDLVESTIPENSGQSFVKSEKTEDSAEDIVETGKERMGVNVLEKTKSIEESEKGDTTLKSELGGEVKKDNEEVREELDDEKVKEELDDDGVREELDDEKVKEELDEKVKEELDDEKVKKELDDDRVREELDNEKVKEELDDDRVREELDDEKVKEELDEKVKEELDDEKVKEELDDDRVREELDNEKVKGELDDDVAEDKDDEKVREKLYDEKVKEELDDDGVREELDDDLAEDKDDEKVRQSDDEKVREKLYENPEDILKSEVEGEVKKDNEVEEETDDEKVREVDDEVREELKNEEKGILRESLDDAEKDETDQKEPFLKAGLMESLNEEKSREASQTKSLEEGTENADESTLQLENPENSSAETSLKTSEQSQEENEEVDGTENDEASLKASKPRNTGEIQDTINDGKLKAAEPREVEDSDMDNEESPLRSENPEKDTEISNESLMNTSGSQEKVEAIHDEIVNEENKETDKDTEEIVSAEVEKAEQPKETENVEYSREANLNEESTEINKTPKLLMKIKENLLDEKTVRGNQEEKDEESRDPMEDTLNSSEADDQKTESKNVNEEVLVSASNSEADQERSEVVQDAREMDEEDSVNVRSEDLKDLDNRIEDEGQEDGELRSAKAEPEELNEDGTLKINSIERKDFEKNLVERAKQKGPETEQMTVGKEKNAPASEEGQNQSKSTLKVPKSIGKIMRDLDGKEQDDYASLTNLNPEEIDHIIDKIDEAEHRNKVESDSVDCRKECACADEMNIRSRNIGRYEIAKDFLRWVKDLQLNRVLTDS